MPIYNRMVVDQLADEQADRVFHALADPTRRNILLRTLEGEHNVSALARGYPMSFAAVQKHVAVLEGAGLVIKERKGREQLVRGNVDTMRRGVPVARGVGSGLEGPHGPDRRAARRRRQRRTEVMITPTITTDPQALTMTVTAELDVPVERAWQLWADPRQFERWWAPPSFPMTVKEHDLVPGGRISFFMTGPDGDRRAAMWEVLAVDPPTRLELKDAIVDDNGTPIDEGPASVVVTFTARAGGGTTMATELAFPSLEAVEQATQQMGMADGMKITFAQIEGVSLADVGLVSPSLHPWGARASRAERVAMRRRCAGPATDPSNLLRVMPAEGGTT